MHQTEADFAAAIEMLTRHDAALRTLVEEFGVPDFWHRPAGFSTLVLFILEQQVSLASAAATYERLRRTVERIDPETLQSAGSDVVRGAGVTRQKTGYILGIAQAMHTGALDLSALSNATDDDARSRLTDITGIGPWTADVYLLSCLRRPDVWPVGDRALRVGTAETLGLAAVPLEDDLIEIGERWRPHRSTAARLLWHRYLSVRGR